LHVSLQETHGWHFARPKSATRWLLCVCAFFLAVGSASAANPLTVWKERLFGRDGAEPVVRDAPDEGVVVLGLNRPERIHVDTRNGSRKFPKGESHFREIELSREYEHIAVRVQVIATSNPKGRGNAVYKPILYVLDDKGEVRAEKLVEPLHLDIRPFKPTRLLACVTLDKVRRLALATPDVALKKSFQSDSRSKLKSSNKSAFYYSTDAVKVQMPFIDSGDIVLEVISATKKGEGC
jgi:hypothetical protein